MSGCLDKSEIRRKVIGLGDNSYKKSYYPQLQSQIGELTEQKNLLEKANAELTYTLDALKRTQESLAVNENKYHTLFENAGDAILIIDAASFELADYNMKAMAFLGFQSKDDIIVRNIFYYMPECQPNGRNSEEYAKEVLEKVINGEPTVLEWEIRKVDGRIAICDVSLISIEIEGEYQVQTIIRDITDLRKLEYQQAMSTIRSVENERIRFSKELHDGIGPILSTIKLYLDCLEEECESERHRLVLNKANFSVGEATKAIKEIAYDLSPHILVNYGVASAVRNFIDNIKLTSLLEVNFTCNECDRLHSDIEIMLYRVVTELLNNTIKHANATKVNIEIEKHNKSLKFKLL